MEGTRLKNVFGQLSKTAKIAYSSFKTPCAVTPTVSGSVISNHVFFPPQFGLFGQARTGQKNSDVDQINCIEKQAQITNCGVIWGLI